MMRKEISDNGDIFWYLDDKLHRDDGPAIEYGHGSYIIKEWYRHGLNHREDGPAIEFSDGAKQWIQNDNFHRVDGPAIERADGSGEWYLNGILHRIGGPAVEIILSYSNGFSNNHTEWYLNGKRHRVDGPAIEWYNIFENCPEDNIKRVEWWINEKFLSSQETKIHQTSRVQSIMIALSPLELPPYIVFWILEWSENAYIGQLSQRAVIKMLEGVRNSRNAIKHS